MPDLPTLTVTDAQMTVILDAFKAMYGTTTAAETATAYRRALAEMVIEAVRSHQEDLIRQQAEAAITAKNLEVKNFFPDPNTIP